MRTDEHTIAGRYDLRERVGSGGSGDVWLAEDRELGRDVAVKLVRIPRHLSRDERGRARDRVLREARAAARLDHPGVTRVYDVLEDDGSVAIVMAYVEAPTLQELVARDGALSDDRAAQVGLEILDALEVAHGRGVVHRDVKPSNVLVSRGGVKLTDFGIAALSDETELTRTGTALGSPGYLAPEQASGDGAGPSADLWGLGATLYYAVEGAPPFDRGRAVATLHAVVHDDPDAPSSGSTLLPLIRSLLAKDPDARPTVADIRGRLAEAASGPHTTVAMAAIAAEDPTERMPSSAAAPQAGARTQPQPEPREQQPPREHAGAVHGEEQDESRTGRIIGTLIALAFVAVLGGLVWLWASATGDPDDGIVATGDEATTEATSEPTDRGGAAAPDATSDPQDGSTQDDSAQETETSEQQETEEGSAAVPEGWSVFSGPAYAVAHPPSWEAREDSGPRIDLTDPETGSYLRLDYTDEPKPDPVADWEEQSEAFADRYGGYEEIRIEPVDYRDFDAAIWEYEYVTEGQRFHAYNLGFTDGECGYALNLQAPAERWSDIEPLFEDFMASFEPQGC